MENKTTPTFRDYQDDMISVAIAELNKKTCKPFILQAATGAGKSLVIAGVAHQMNQPALVLQPSKELLNQNFEKMKLMDIEDVTKYSASVGEKEIGFITMATIGSIHKTPELFQRFKLIIIDECHMVNVKDDKSMLISFLKALGDVKVVGLTATPYRLDTTYVRAPGGVLEATAALKMVNRMTKTPLFKKIAYKIETQELIDRGYLAPIKYFTERADWSSLNINSTGADFKDDEALEKFNNKRVQRIVDAVTYSHQNNRTTLTFCGSIDQAKEASRQLESKGIYAPIVTGTTTTIVRDKIVNGFKDGTISHILNVGVFTTGFDAPKLDTVIMAKATMSLQLWYQIVGRGVRLDPDVPDKVLFVFDLSGVTKRLGRVETIHVRKEAGGFRDEVWSEVGRMDGYPLYKYRVEPKKKEKKDDRKT